MWRTRCGTNLRSTHQAPFRLPGWPGHGVLVAALGLLFVFAVAVPAGAHGDGETEEGYLLVQQALAHLAHDTGHEGMDLAMEKVDDALATKDQEGVAVAEVEQAKRALKADHVERARVLLQGSITEALDNLAPAVGEETGTTVVVPALPGRSDLTGRDWTFLGSSLICLLAGALLAYRFRPADTVDELRRRLQPPRALPADAGEPPQAGGR
jgi:hypothetical protein